jgi:glycosyltransferase involved in cell wall biosynthesis
MENRFVIIVPFYNVKNYIKECYESVLEQTYTNWIIMFGDDCSTDGSLDLIPDNEKFIKIRNKERITALPNTHTLITLILNPSPDDIIVILDGDDKLLNKSVLEYLNNFYNKHNPLLVYGQYVKSDGDRGWAKGFNDVNNYNNLRKNNGYFLSHIRTWKLKLYIELLRQDPDLNCYKNTKGEFYQTCADVAVMFPLVEIAGYNNVKFNPEPVYWYRLYDNNDHVIRKDEQFNTEQEIKNKPKFKQKF